MTATIGAMQNNIRSFRVEDELWLEAVRVAGENGESVAKILRAALVQYVKKNRKA